jgi:hypothetical protein
MTVFVAIWSKTSRVESQTKRLSQLTKACNKAQERFTSWQSGVLNRVSSFFSATPPFSMIFLAPEYLFSAPRANILGAKALMEDERDIVIQNLLGLSRRIPQMLLVPGTIAYKKKVIRPESQKRRMDPNTGERTGRVKEKSRYDKALWKFDNHWAAVDYAYSVNIPNLANTAMELVAQRKQKFMNQYEEFQTWGSAGWWGVDEPEIFKNTMYVFLSGSIICKYSKQGDWFESLSDKNAHFNPGGRPNIHILKGIRFGFEICRDHSLNVATTTIASYKARNLATVLGAEPQIHIVLSDEVEIENYPMCNNGYLLHACTNEPNSGVWYKDDKGKSGRANSMMEEYFDTVSGAKLEYWIINI